jgi:hypothetical protein
MRRVLRLPVLGVIVVAGASLMGARAHANDSTTHSRSSRRQLADCIIKKMSADRLVSFNNATRACRELTKAQDENNLASNTPGQPVNGR